MEGLLPLKVDPFTLSSSDSKPGRVAQSVGYLTLKSGVLGSIPGLATYFRFSVRFLRRAVVSYWRKYVHKELVNRLGGLSLPRKSVVRLTDRPDMTLDVYRGRKTTMQQQQQHQILFGHRSPLNFVWRTSSCECAAPFMARN